jgi:hypothetical protein
MAPNQILDVFARRKSPRDEKRPEMKPKTNNDRLGGSDDN